MTDLKWDSGTAYDMFVSLLVLHHPTEFGVRPSWAAGMRSRLPSEERETLETLVLAAYVPFEFIHALPTPKSGATLLEELAKLPQEARLSALCYRCEKSERFSKVLREVSDKGAWDQEDLKVLSETSTDETQFKKLKNKQLEALLDLWIDVPASGEKILRALRAYYDMFFAEEETRIQPALEKSLAHAKALASERPLIDLLEELSRGVRLEQDFDVDTLYLAPSFWTTPLLLFGSLGIETEIILFGARPDNFSLVPGEVIPDDLLNGMKALSDPTRLKILHYLSQESLTPTQLSQRLRLRTSTVSHHLDVLRLATLVQLQLTTGKEKRYATRTDTLDRLTYSLRDFIGMQD